MTYNQHIPIDVSLLHIKIIILQKIFGMTMKEYSVPDDMQSGSLKTETKLMRG